MNDNIKNLRIAYVKSSVYQDLWVCDITNDPIEIFKTTLVRCPPIGLASDFGADFIIVKDIDEYPCNVYKNCLSKDHCDHLKFSKNNKNLGLPFLDESYHNHVTIDSVAHNVDDIDWNKYHIVVCINTCIPERILMKYKMVLWCYLSGENDAKYVSNLISRYDVVLNQDVFLGGSLPNFSIGFPYSFLGPFTIENMLHRMGIFYGNNISEKIGIYQEINNSTERPVTIAHPGFVDIGLKCNMPIILHSQNIVENITRIYRTKYFVKLFGRVIRGNGILEVISAGTLILMNKNLIMFHDLIPDECHVESSQDVIKKIKYFEENLGEYERLVLEQRHLLNTLYYEKPLSDLYKKFCEKSSIY